MPMPNFDLTAIQDMANKALQVVTLYSDLLAVLGGVILSGVVVEVFIRLIRNRLPD